MGQGVNGGYTKFIPSTNGKEEKDNFQELMQLLQILHQLAKHENISLLAGEGYLHTKINEGSDETHEYIFENFNEPIQLKDVAAVAGMNPSEYIRLHQLSKDKEKRQVSISS